MKDIIAQRLDEKWDTVILDGTKPPVNKYLRKKLNSIRKNQLSSTTITTTGSTAALVIVVYFEKGGGNRKL